jgi:hypothetical protein
MTGRGRFGKYGDLKRKEKLREGRQTPPAGAAHKLDKAQRRESPRKRTKPTA